MIMYILLGVALIVASIALLIACVALAMCYGLKNSTHKIQWMPAESTPTLDLEKAFNKIEEELEESME